MDFLDIDFPELPSISPDLIFEEDPPVVVEASAPKPTVTKLTPGDRENLIHLVLDDHAYAKPYPERQSKAGKHTVPLRVLKLHGDHPERTKFKRNASMYQSHGSEDDEDEIDVVNIEPSPEENLVNYDKTRANNVMNEVEAYLNSLWKDVDKDDDEKICRGNWSKDQAGFFDSVYKQITNYHLAKLTYYMNSNEPVLRKLALDKATKRTRHAFSTIFWSPKLIFWLHSVMIDGLGSSFFLCYLEILQSLKRKTPTLFERIIASDKVITDKELSLPNLGPRLKKSWESAPGIQSNLTVEKFRSVPFLLIIPSGPSVPHQSTKRNRFWNNQLTNFSKVFSISTPAFKTVEGYDIKMYLEHCITTVRTKIIELRDRFPTRPVVLVGWGVGSLICLRIASLDKVDAVVCLGFPTKGIDGESSDGYWKGMAKIESPVLFFLGSRAATNSLSDIEKLRRKIKAQTDLVLVEDAEEMLQISSSIKRNLGMTQNMIDKLIQDEIYLFLKNVLLKIKPSTPVTRGRPAGKKRKKKDCPPEKVDTKKKKRSAVKSPLAVSDIGTNPSMLPLDVSISPIDALSPVGSSGGLLTTGSAYPCIDLSDSKTLSCVTNNVLLHNPGPFHSEVLDNAALNDLKEKVRRGRQFKKNVKYNLNSEAQMPNNGEKAIEGLTSISESLQGNTSFQHVPTGSFVLSGAAGQVRLQGAANVVYLQQTTSGTPKVLSPSDVNTANGTFTAIMTSSPVTNPPTKINIVPASNFRFGPVTSKGMSGVISAGGCGGLVLTPTSTQSPLLTPLSLDVASTCSPLVETPATAIIKPIRTSSIENIHRDTSAGPVTSSVATSTIMTHLSANDIRYLASLIAKHSNSRPNSPTTTTANNSILLPGKTESKPHVKFADDISSSMQTKAITGKSPFTSIFDKKLAIASVSQLVKKVQPASLVQHVATIPAKDQVVKMKAPRMKTSKLASPIPIGYVVANETAKASNVLTSKIVHKIPATLTIPISKLQASINLSASSLSSGKSINVPLLSTCIPHEKIIISATKSSETVDNSKCNTVTTTFARKSPIIIGQPSLGSSTKGNNMAVFPASHAIVPNSSRTNTNPGLFLNKSSFNAGLRSPVKGNSPSPIAVNIPSHVSMRDPKVLRKAVSDVKVVGVLSQQQAKAQAGSLLNLSALRSLSNPSSPQRSPTPDEFNDEITTPLIKHQLAEMKASERRKHNFSPLRQSTLALNLDVRSTTSYCSSHDILTTTKSVSGGQSEKTTFLGKLFATPKPQGDSLTDKSKNIELSIAGKKKGDKDKSLNTEGFNVVEENESDVDFAISPGSPAEPLGTVQINKPFLDHVKQTNRLASKNKAEATQANLGDWQFAADSNLSKSHDGNVPSIDLWLDCVSSGNGVDSTVPFQPVKSIGPQLNLTSLSSRREEMTNKGNSVVFFPNSCAVPNPTAPRSTKSSTITVSNLSTKHLSGETAGNDIKCESTSQNLEEGELFTSVRSNSSEKLSKLSASIRHSFKSNGVYENKGSAGHSTSTSISAGVISTEGGSSKSVDLVSTDKKASFLFSGQERTGSVHEGKSKTRGSFYLEGTARSTKEHTSSSIATDEERTQPYATRSGRSKRSRYNVQYVDQPDTKKAMKNQSAQGRKEIKQRKNFEPDVVLLDDEKQSLETNQLSDVRVNGANDIGKVERVSVVKELMGEKSLNKQTTFDPLFINTDTRIDTTKETFVSNFYRDLDNNPSSVVKNVDTSRNRCAHSSKTSINTGEKKIVMPHLAAIEMGSTKHKINLPIETANVGLLEVERVSKGTDEKDMSSPPALAVIQDVYGDLRIEKVSDLSTNTFKNSSQGTYDGSSVKPLPPLLAAISTTCASTKDSSFSSSSNFGNCAMNKSYDLPEPCHVEPLSIIYQTSSLISESGQDIEEKS